jgi:hypothetical protein
MPRAQPVPVRRAILNRTRHSQSSAEIAQELNVPERTVRRLVTGFRERGESALQVSYGACGVSRSVEFVRLREQVLELRRQHPLWGAGRLLLELELSAPDTGVLPTERTLQRWLREVYPKPAPAGRPAQESLSRATHPHQVWQVDAVEQKRFGNGKMFSWLRVVDECSGAVLKTVVFSRGTFFSSTSSPSSAGIPQDFPAVGPPWHDSGGQRRTVGFVQRSAAATGFVDHRTGGRHALEHTLPTSRKWCCRTQSRTGHSLGRAETPSDRTQIPEADRPGRLPAAGTTSSDRRPHAMRGLSRIEDCGGNLQLSLGTNTLGLESSPPALESVCSYQTCRLLG